MDELKKVELTEGQWDLVMQALEVYYDGAERMTNAIIDEYESLVTRKGESLWRKFELSGDDDVDYNGGYIQIFVDAILILEGNNAEGDNRPTR